jgi:Mn2+/Fe2+ NRAMP family transporter
LAAVLPAELYCGQAAAVLDIKWARLDTFLGALFTIIVAGCMMIAGNAARIHGISFSDPAQMANDLHLALGEAVRSAILLLMMNAAVLSKTAISLSSAWAYGEVKGWPHSLEMPVRKAPGFYVFYLACWPVLCCPRRLSSCNCC